MPIRYLVSFSVLSFVLCMVCASAATAQGPTPRSASDAAKVKEKINKLGIGAELTIVQQGGKTFHGAISQIGGDTFVISEIDLKTNVEIRYDQVKHLDKGYSHPDPITGKRMPPKTRKVIGWALAGVAVVLIVVIAKALNDPNF